MGCSPAGETFTFSPGHTVPPQTPVFTARSDEMPISDYYLLTDEETGDPVYAQRWNRDSIAFLSTKTREAGHSMTFRLEERSTPLPSVVRLIQDPETIQIYVDDRPVLTYHIATVQPAEGAPA